MKKIILIGIFILLLINISLAQESYVFKQSEITDIRISCFDENSSVCTSAVVCGLTIIHPNTSLVLNNATMTYNGTTYNYTLSMDETNDVGEYFAIVSCDGNTDGYATFTYLITPNGENPSTASGLFYLGLFTIIFIFLLLSMIGAKNVRNPFYKAGLICLSYVFFVMTMFISWNMASNFLTSAPFLTNMLFNFWRISMVGILPFVIALFVWSIFEFRKVKVIDNLIKDKGISEAEAIARVRGKKW